MPFDDTPAYMYGLSHMWEKDNFLLLGKFQA